MPLADEDDAVECVQGSGDMIVTFTDASHCGFDSGFDAAASTNLATERWAAMGRRATFCRRRQAATACVDVSRFEDWRDRGAER